jgi:tetratricopeptide (TPR) repeat protein
MIRGLREAGVIVDRAVTMSVAELSSAPLPIPRSIREALEKQLRVLSADALEVARLVGLAQQEVGAELLQLATSLEEPALAAVLDELIDAGLLTERRVGLVERFELVHLRLQDVLIEATPVVARRSLHRRLGLSLELLSRHNVEPIVELLAYHFDEAGSAAKAHAYMVWAAEKLQRQAFTADALRFLDRAVELEPLTREYMTLVEAEKRRADVLLQRANALYHLGRWDEAATAAREADLLAIGLGDDMLLARTATELACQARSMSTYDEASAQLSRALAHAEAAGAPQLRIVPLYEEGAMRWGEGDLAAASALLEEALQLSERFGDGRGLALGANGLGVLAMCEGRSAEARRYFDKAITVCEEHGLMERLAIARTNLAELSHCMGNIRKGLTLADRTITAAREVGHSYGVSIGLRYRALLLGDLGRWAEAEENATEAMRLQQQLGNRDEELASTVALTRVVMARGDTEQASALLERCLELAGDFDTEGYLPVVRAWRSQILASSGDQAAALAELEAAGEGHSWPHQRLRQQLNAARAWRLVGERQRAAALADEALRLAETCGYRYYAMRARQILVEVNDSDDDNAASSRHRRIAEALARSLAAALPAEDATSFLTQQGLEARTHQRRRLRTRS